MVDAEIKPPTHRMSDYKSDCLTGGSTSQPTERQINLFTLVTRRQYCPGRPKELCFTTLSLAMETMGTRLSVVKQSFFGPPGQYGRLVTRANWPAKWPAQQMTLNELTITSWLAEPPLSDWKIYALIICFPVGLPPGYPQGIVFRDKQKLFKGPV